jgi:hypothetical protein
MEYSCINLPSNVAEAPNEINTREKPKIKLKAPTKTRYIDLGLLLFCPLSSWRDMPETKEIYPGTKGKIQGERKERIPAIKAAR